MGNNLFGANISGIIATNVGPGLVPLNYTRMITAPNTERLTGKPTKTPFTRTSTGQVEQFTKRERQRPEIQSNDVKILIIADTLGNGPDDRPFIPQEGDTIAFTRGVYVGKTYHVQDLLDIDPDAATYLVHARV